MLPFSSTLPVPLPNRLGAFPAPAHPTPVCSLASGPRASRRAQALAKSKVAIQEPLYLGQVGVRAAGRMDSRYAGGKFSGNAIIVYLYLF